MIKNWNEESKLAKTPEELVEIDMFYRTYIDQYNVRQRTLARLMEIYVEYYKDVTSLEIPQSEPLSEQTIPLPTPRTKRTTPDQTMEGMPSSRRDQEVRETVTNETHPKQGQTEEKHPPTPRHTQIIPTMMMRSTALIITPPTPSLRFPLSTTSETSGTTRTTSQGRLSTLSSMVRPMPTTATRTVAIT